MGVGQIPHRGGLAGVGVVAAGVVVAVLAGVGDVGDGLEGVLGDLGYRCALAVCPWRGLGPCGGRRRGARVLLVWH